MSSYDHPDYDGSSAYPAGYYPNRRRDSRPPGNMIHPPHIAATSASRPPHGQTHGDALHHSAPSQPYRAMHATPYVQGHIQESSRLGTSSASHPSESVNSGYRAPNNLLYLESNSGVHAGVISHVTRAGSAQEYEGHHAAFPGHVGGYPDRSLQHPSVESKKAEMTTKAYQSCRDQQTHGTLTAYSQRRPEIQTQALQPSYNPSMGNRVEFDASRVAYPWVATHTSFLNLSNAGRSPPWSPEYSRRDESVYNAKTANRQDEASYLGVDHTYSGGESAYGQSVDSPNATDGTNSSSQDSEDDPTLRLSQDPQNGTLSSSFGIALNRGTWFATLTCQTRPLNQRIHSEAIPDTAEDPLGIDPYYVGSQAARSGGRRISDSSNTDTHRYLSRQNHSGRDNTTHPVVCPICGKTYSGEYRKGNLARHRRHKHGDEEQLYHCEEPGCYQVFKRQDARLKHYRKHHNWLAPNPPLPRKF